MRITWHFVSTLLWKYLRKERPIVDDSTENDINVGSTLPFRDDSHIDSFFEMNGSTKALTDYASLKCSGP